MTVSTELSHEEYVGNGVTTDFDFRFRIFESRHLIVVVADSEGNETTLKNGTDYFIVGVGSYFGGKVVLSKPLAKDWKILLERDLPVVQETDLRNQGKFFAEVHEDAFDYLTMLIQKALGTFSLSLRKPTYLSNYYDAKDNRIANLAPPKLGSDSANKDYVDNSIKDIDSKTLRVKDKPIPALPSAEQRRNKQLGFDNEGYPQLLDPAETGSLGYVLVDSFEKGAEITTRYQALHWESNGEYYRWDGDLPKSILVNSTPENSGGIGLGRWISVGDSSLRGQLNNCFTDVSELRKSKNLNVNIPIVLINYNRNINGGGGAFYVDSNDTITPDNSGTVFINKSGQRIKRILSNICRWEDFGIINNSPLVTKENCEAAFKWGFENGYTKFETSISEITLDFPLHIKIPDDYIYDSIEINSSGVHKFKYDLVIQIPEWQHKKTDYLYAIFGNGKTRVNINLNFDNSGMGNSKPNTRGKTIGLRIDDCPNSYLNVFGKNNNGYGVWIVSSDNTEIKLVGRNLDGYQSTDIKDDSGNVVAFDDYGDALYIASNNITVSYLDVRTDRGGRAGVVFEGTFTKSESVNGQLNNFNIVGYDRGVHIESTKENMGSIFISNGRLLNNNTQILSFNGNIDKDINRIDTFVDKVEFKYNNQISPWITEGKSIFSKGHFMLSGGTLSTSNCIFHRHTNSSVCVGSGLYRGDGDIWLDSSMFISAPYSDVELHNVNARLCKNKIELSNNAMICSCVFGGDLNLKGAWSKYTLRNIVFNGTKENPSGHLNMPGVRRSSYIDNITFDYVNDYAIDNTNENTKYSIPVINMIKVLNGNKGGKLFKSDEEQYKNRYVRSLPSFTAFDGIENEIK